MYDNIECSLDEYDICDYETIREFTIQIICYYIC